MRDVHPTAADGFEAAATDYERYRPGYPQPTMERLRTQLGLGPDRRVVDLAAGTGKLTRPLLVTGAEVVAIEPVAAMRRELARQLPGVDVRNGTAESLPLADASADAVTVGQAFHWFDPARALAEIHRVLRPGGSLAVVFNRRDLSTPAQAALDDLLMPYRGETPSWSDHRWRHALADPPGFIPQELEETPHEQAVDADGFVGRVASVSFVASLEAPTRAAVLGETRALFERFSDATGHVKLAYVTELRVLRRAGS